MPRPVPAALLAALCLGFAPQARAQQTPPIAPKITETPLPPSVELPPPPAPPPADVPNRPLTADEAARIALFHQPNVIIARANVQAAQGRTQQQRSAELPQVGLSAGYTDTEVLAGQVSGTSNPSGGTTAVTSIPFTASLALSQLIFNFNHTRDLVRQTEAQEQAANATLTQVQSDLVLLVKQAFYIYVQNARLVTVNESNVRNQQAQLALAQARLATGLGLPSDVITAQTAVSDAIFNLNLARNNASVSRVTLALDMGIDPRTPIDAANTDEPAIPADDVNALVNTALTQRPEIRAAQANIQASRYGVSAARTNNAPSVSADLGVSSRGSSFPPGNDLFTVGVAINWDLFDSGFTAGLVKQARANLLASQAQLTGVQLTVTSDVSQAYLNLRTAEQRVTTADAEVANAEESVRLNQGRYSAGLGIFLDVLNAQASLVTAQTNRVNAQTSVDEARAALYHAIGAPLPALR